MVTYTLRGTLIAGMLAVAGNVIAASEPPKDPWDKFSISLGGFTSRSSSELQINNTNTGLGVSIDLENTLAVESRFDTVRLDTLYRWGKTNRH